MTTYLETPVIDKKVKHPARWLIGLVAAGVLVIGATTTYTVVNRGTSKQDITALTVPVEAKDVTVRISASGIVQPVQSVNISPKNSGTLVQLYVEQGDKVTQGQIIAKMDSADIQARIAEARANLAQNQAQLDQVVAGNRPQEIDQAKARLAQAEAQLAQARAGNRPQEIAQAQAQVDAAQAKAKYTTEQLKRYQSLYQQGAEKKQLLDQAISEDNAAKASLLEAEKRLSLQQIGTRSEEVSQKEATVAESRAALQLSQAGSRPEEIAQRKAAVGAAQAKLKTEQVNLDNTIIRAPFSGIVTQKYANVGAYVTPTTSASSSASATSSSVVAVARGLEVLASVPEADIGRIKQGQQVEIVADAYPDQVFKGHVRLIAPEAVKEEGVTLFQIRVAIDTGRDKLRSGLNVNMTFLGDKVQDALLVPTVAIVTEKGNTGVLVPDAKNKPQFRPVTIGAQIKDQTQILEGVKGGDRIFLNPPADYMIQKKQEQEKK
ncbi:efflux transporter periplasmic adaptor subunit [Brasilonema octagenarum UFV-E1]|uniref:Efflux transporter periplasmic adaptor subunit n=1 Tax=Brasilonema sennae CENA114 TaxID=415709 RepID=A0A856MA15_9CYAN|nr:efflux RND transporter periplasmic adaptor subunit [Brasilonema sennae]QDL06601.1 efflux transporter periplasmic adaptor subunit [Brasilonema sennae CENA114]QDL12971.1 efflux transporter periplasmic adaptor subunit [Brasilonema octagenarum UFV-E1]